MRPKIILIFLLMVFFGVLLFTRQLFRKPEEIHFHAGFVIFSDGKKQDYSDSKYMSLEQCDEKENHKQTEEHKVDLHNNIGSVVHVHTADVVWEELFGWLKLKFDKSKPVRSFVNGKEVTNISDRKINPYDSLLLMIGEYKEIKPYLDQAVTEKYIKEVEKKGESC